MLINLWKSAASVWIKQRFPPFLWRSSPERVRYARRGASHESQPEDFRMARAIWSGSISFGMVTIPAKLYGATESKDIAFHLLHAKDGTRLQQKRWCPTDETDVPWSETVRGYEYAKGQYV